MWTNINDSLKVKFTNELPKSRNKAYDLLNLAYVYQSIAKNTSVVCYFRVTVYIMLTAAVS